MQPINNPEQQHSVIRPHPESHLTECSISQSAEINTLEVSDPERCGAFVNHCLYIRQSLKWYYDSAVQETMQACKNLPICSLIDVLKLLRNQLWLLSLNKQCLNRVNGDSLKRFWFPCKHFKAKPNKSAAVSRGNLIIKERMIFKAASGRHWNNGHARRWSFLVFVQGNQS